MTTANTPEEIADVLVGLVNSTGRELIAQKIRAYGEACRQEALSLSIPKEPTKLERVARAIFAPDGQIPGGRAWELYRPDEREWFLIRARAAIEALKVDPSESVAFPMRGDLSNDFYVYGRRLNDWFDSILNEGK